MAPFAQKPRSETATDMVLRPLPSLTQLTSPSSSSISHLHLLPSCSPRLLFNNGLLLRLTSIAFLFALLLCWPVRTFQRDRSHVRLEAYTVLVQNSASFERDAAGVSHEDADAAVSEEGKHHHQHHVIPKTLSEPLLFRAVRPRQIHVPPSTPTGGGNRARRILRQQQPQPY